jgi:heptosyltransferase-2
MRLIVQTAFLGDAILSIPLLRALRDEGPLHLVVRQGLGDFFRRTKLVDEVFEVEKGSAASYSALSSHLRTHRYQEVLAVHESFRTAWFVRSLQADKKVGYRKWWSSLFWDESFDRPTEWPEALRALALRSGSPIWKDRLKHWHREMATANGGVLANGELAKVPEWASLRVAELSNRTRSSRAVIAPGSVWATKRWTEEGFVELARSLRENKLVDEIVWSGARDEAELCSSLAARAGGRVVAGQLSIWQTAELMAESKVVVGNDSGAQHLACLSDTPVVSIFGPTVLEFGYRPWSNRARVVEEGRGPQRMACRPCGKHGSQQCPIRTHACMKNVRPLAVFEAARSLIGKARD